MREYLKFYIDGQWVDPSEVNTAEVINPATEEASGRISLGSEADVVSAVAAARRAFASYSQTSREQRLELMRALQGEYGRRQKELGEAITEEMGAPLSLGCSFHVDLGAGHLQTAIEVLEKFEFEDLRGPTMIRREPIGVCALITPWNWPVNQVAVKVFPALATGCSMILKPPQLAPYSAQILAEMIDAAGFPAGVFNMIQGSGSRVGTALCRHPDVDMVSFTGSEPVGAQISKDAADTIKRVCLELGGKSPFIVLDDEDMEKNIAEAVGGMMVNSGQTCTAGSRLLVPRARLEEAKAAARTAAEGVTVGDPNGEVAMGPVVSKSQFNTVQEYIEQGIAEGAELIAGGPGRPDGMDKGFYVKPTVLLTDNSMRIAREEVFGPVLCMIAYDDIDEAVSIANDTVYGLAGYVVGKDQEACRAVARRIRAGWVNINNGFDFYAPVGGYKRSGNGREWGEFGFEEYLETKAMLGYVPVEA